MDGYGAVHATICTMSLPRGRLITRVGAYPAMAGSSRQDMLQCAPTAFVATCRDAKFLTETMPSLPITGYASSDSGFEHARWERARRLA